MLQISRKPDVSFLRANGEEISRHKEEPSEGQDKCQIPPIYFAVAGSGKTQSIFDHLAAEWGYYLISGRIPDSLSHTYSILGSCHGGASADTQWLYKFFKRLESNTNRLPPESYCLAIQVLLANREDFMTMWTRQTNLEYSIYWLLFQTICTPVYDPFKATLELRMLFDKFQIFPRAFESTRTPTAVMDEAQYEVELFWNGRPSVERFIRATDKSSVAGTSLRLKEYRKIICNDPLNAHYVMPDYLNRTVVALSNHVLGLISPRQTSGFANRLAHRVLRFLEDDNAESGEWKWTHLIENTKLMNILGEFYFTETLNTAKDKSIRKYLEEGKDFFIRYYRDQLSNEFVPSMESHKKGRLTEDSLTEVFTLVHSRLWPPPALVPESDNNILLTQWSLHNSLTKRILSRFLDKISPTRFHLILSNPVFSKLLNAQTQRLLRRIEYFCSLDHLTTRYEFWRIACPETIVFQNTEDTEGKKEFYSRAMALLKSHAVTTETPKVDDFESAVQEAVRGFRIR